MMRDLTVEQHSTWNGLVLSVDSSHLPRNPQENAQHALHHLFLVSEPTLYFSANVNLPQP